MTGGELFERYGIFSILMLFAVVWAAFLLGRRNKYSRRDGPRPVWHYFLLWPLILQRDDLGKRTGKSLLSSREVAGWVVVVLLLVLAIAFGW